MVGLLKVKINGKEILIEPERSEYPEGGPRLVGVKEKIEGATGEIAIQIFNTISALATVVIDTINTLPEEKTPSTLRVEFGLSVSGEGNVYIVKTGAQASLNISAEWEIRAKHEN